MTLLRRMTAAAVAWALVCGTLHAQEAKAAKAAPEPKVPYYIDPLVLHLDAVIPDPPAIDSPANVAELGELHRIESSRTAAQVAAANADQDQENIFAYQSVLGAGFNPEALPVTAALSVHVKNEQGVAGAALKPVFRRPRPYLTDPTLHPACPLSESVSYPSGHAVTGYLEGFTLAEMVPEKRSEILARAEEYAHNRVICGLHYPSDVEASRRVAYVVFGYMMATPRFQHDLALARTELRAKLGLTAK